MALDVLPISGPSIDGGLVYLCKRSEITQQIVENACNLAEYPARRGRRKLTSSKLEKVGTDCFDLKKSSDYLGVTQHKLIHSYRNKGFIASSKGQKECGREHLVFALRAIDELKVLLDLQATSLTLSEAAGVFGITTHQFVSTWCNNGLVEILNLPDGKFISKLAMNELRKQAEELCTAKTLSKFLDVKLSAIRFWVRTGKLVPWKSPVLTRPATRLFSRRAFEEFLRSDDEYRVYIPEKKTGAKRLLSFVFWSSQLY